MRIAIVASPFITIPPAAYGGTELFIADLAEGLQQDGVTPVVYCNGQSTVEVEKRSCYAEADWPLSSESEGMLKEMDHVAWSIADAARECDVIHVNSASAVSYSRLVDLPFVCTLHHPYEEALTRLYERNPQVCYTAISHDQACLYAGVDVHVIHHGLDFRKYHLQTRKEGYLSFLGRIAPIKGTHLAIQVAQRLGMPLKIAGEIQPIYRDYFETMIKPHLDGKSVEYVGELGLEGKNELLGRSSGLLFPIQWQEPFGLVLVESMACGTPVFAFPRGAVSEIVAEGVSGAICSSVEEMASTIRNSSFEPAEVRANACSKFSVETMVGHYLELYKTLLKSERGQSAKEVAA